MTGSGDRLCPCRTVFGKPSHSYSLARAKNTLFTRNYLCPANAGLRFRSGIAIAIRSRKLQRDRTARTLLFLFCCIQQPVGANEDSVLVAVKQIYAELCPVLVKKNLDVICIGGFTGGPATSSGPEIQLKLRQVVEQAGEFKINAIDYKAVIRGQIEMLDANQSLSVRLKVQVFDVRNVPIIQVSGVALEAKADIAGQEAVPRLLGITSNSAGASPMLRAQRFLKDFETDPSYIEGHKVFAAKGSPYSIELLPVGQGSRAVAVGEKFEDCKTTELRSIGNLQATIQVRYEK